ncbi:MAG: SRPBCC family protein [Acidobacteria bacterium]|nr:SRPBCC family protein [Acidobacteriota bacterium]
MYWVLGLLGLLVLIGIVVIVIGNFLPEQHVASRTLTLRQSPETTWQVITDFANQPKWHPDMKNVERLADRNGHTVWQEEVAGMKIPLETLETEAPKKLVRRIASDDLGFGGDWEYIITPTIEGGCQLTVTEHGKVPNPLFRFMSRYVFGHTATIEKYLTALAGKFGESPVIR